MVPTCTVCYTEGLMAEKIKLALLGADPNQIQEMHLVGRYALGVTWEDGHGSIYPFVFLRRQCPCDQCADRRLEAPPEAESWPTEMKRSEGGLRIAWQSGHETRYPGGGLRKLCQCALCAEERKTQ